MKIELNVSKATHYVSPSVMELTIDSEGVLCSSATHDSFIEDDDWSELFD